MITKEVSEYVNVLTPSLEQNKAQATRFMDRLAEVIMAKMKETPSSGKANATEGEATK